MPKPSTSLTSDLSELEGGVLGVILKCPGSTAHGVRESFRQSRSSHWSGSAGAIYPLMKKLHERGLLAVQESQRGSGVRRAYSITAEGTKALKRWLGPPLAEWVASITFDPLRTRMPFLGVLTPAKQEVFLVNAERLLQVELQETRAARALLRESGAFWEEMATEGCLAITQARLRWIRKTLEVLRAR
jgi:DNA-binding PadR family transcriptional regulator